MENLPTTVAEFLKSDGFTKYVIALPNGYNNTSLSGSSSQSPAASEEGGDHDVDSRKLQENLTRVALLLTKSFANLCGTSGISHDATHHHLSSLELDDFFINLDGNSNNVSVYDGSNNSQETGPLGNCNDLYEYFNQLISEEEEKNKAAVKDRNGRELGLGYFSFNSNDEASQYPPSGSPGETILIDGSKQPQGQNSGRSTEFGLQTITLYGIDIIFPARINDVQQQHLQAVMDTPMKILGKLLYTVFSRGGSPPPSILLAASEKVSSPDGVMDLMLGTLGEGIYERPSTRTGCQRSVFSQLVDSESFPLSICRFISDIIDHDPFGDHQFISFEGVIQELEQLLSQSSLLLHDNISHGTPRPPVIFGQVPFGRDEEVAKIIKIAAQMKQTSREANVGVEAIFVKGIAGSGKSQLVQTASDYLSNLGWVLVKAKFERGAEHNSRGIISSMFDEILSHLVKMKQNGSPSDVSKCERASKSILDSLCHDGVAILVDFLPSLRLLYPDIFWGGEQHAEDWQLVLGLVTIIEAVLESDQRIILCCDDLQWTDRTTLLLVTEVLTKLGENLRQSCRCCLFIGLYREDEVDDDHPFSIQYSYLQMSSSINATELKLTSLKKKDVEDMITSELKLPQRFCGELADAVYKKTSGHAFFIVQLLNSLLRDNTISYSLRKYRYCWDQDSISLLQTGESVAELIASNVYTLPDEALRVIRILSLFGIQTDLALLDLLEKIEGGIHAHLDTFIDRGILDKAGPILIFTHDLIQEAVYVTMSVEERQKLHLEIGQYFGGLAESNDATLGMDRLQLKDHTFYVGNTLASSLISIACDQLDSAGPDAVSDETQKLKFSEWNLRAGQKANNQSDFRAALFYYTKGIGFLGRECWLNDHQLCLALHEGVVMAAFALSESNQVVTYAQRTIQHVSFEDTLRVQPLLLKSLANTGKHNECITRGVSILRRLDFNIPRSPTKETISLSMASTHQIASQFTVDQVVACCEKTVGDGHVGDGHVGDTALNVVRIMDAFYLSCYASASPFLPLVSCELVKYSLQFGVCIESAVAFGSFGMFKIFFENDFATGKKMAEIVRAITKKLQSLNKTNRRNFDIRAHILLYITIDIWFSSPREVSRKLLAYHKSALKLGQVDTAMISLQMGWRYLLYGGGENLSVMMKSLRERVELIAKNSDYAMPYIALDNALLEGLTGQSLNHFSLIEGMVCNIKDIQTSAESTNNNRLLHHIHFNSAILAFWRGDMEEAEKSSRLAWTFPTAKMPTIVLIFHTFFSGLIAYRLYREKGGGEGDRRLQEGRDMTDRMGLWACQTSLQIFGNKWLLMKAELAACTKDYDEAKELYEASIKDARGNGNIHELGIAFELFGQFCSAHDCGVDANALLKKAFVAYTQWGAKAVAERILRTHNVILDSIDEMNSPDGHPKRAR